jgi:hypothetical protein
MHFRRSGLPFTSQSTRSPDADRARPVHEGAAIIGKAHRERKRSGAGGRARDAEYTVSTELLRDCW